MFGCGSSENKSEDTLAVQAAWDEFKEASLSGKGEIAASRVTESTHDYFTEICNEALKLSRDQMKLLALGRQVTVLGMRVRVPKETLETLTGRELFAYAVDKGWIGKNSATDEGITDIEVIGDSAHANATKAGQRIDQLMHFKKEDGMWRLDMTPMMGLVNMAFDAMQKDSGLGEEEFVSRLIEATTGKRLTDADWNAP